MRDSLLKIAKQGGAFRIARRLTGHLARVLCYHGFSSQDEYKFKPKVFMRPETFRARLDLIESMGFKVVSLDDLLERLRDCQPLGHLVAITADDGWQGFYRYAWPELRRRGWPCTLYVTTYCVENDLSVINNVIQYVLWASPRDEVVLGAWSNGRLGTMRKEQGEFAGRDAGTITALVEASPVETRERLIDELATLCGLAASPVADRRFHLCTPAQLAEMARGGVSLQLHTHRHRLPDSPEAIARELADNRAALNAIVPGRYEHLCYPSGEYRVEQFEALAALGIHSGATCNRGLVGRGAHRLALPRILDSESLSPLEFEAELSGFGHLARAYRGRVETMDS